MRSGVIGFLALTVAASSWALDGNDFLKWHKASPNKDMAVLYYIRGMAENEDAYFLLYAGSQPQAPKAGWFAIAREEITPAPFCMPQGATYGQAYDIVIQHLDANPATRHMDASKLVRVALRNAWPCTLPPVSGSTR
jgi:hypothetical protein